MWNLFAYILHGYWRVEAQTFALLDFAGLLSYYFKQKLEGFRILDTFY